MTKVSNAFASKAGYRSHLFGIFSLVKKVKLNWKILLRLFDEPLELEVREEPAHNFHAILHGVDVDLGIAPDVVMLNFDGDFFAIFQGRAVHLCKTRYAEWLWVERVEQLAGLKIISSEKFMTREKVLA